MSDTAPRSFTLGKTRDANTSAPPPPSTGRRAAAGTTPKSVRPMAAAKDVERAVALLDTFYQLIADGLELFSLEETGERWQSAATKLRRTNKDALSASPRLAKQIASIGEGGGATTFFVAHVIAFATLYPVARRELAANAAARPARHAAETAEGGIDWEAMGTPPETAATYDPSVHIPGL